MIKRKIYEFLRWLIDSSIPSTDSRIVGFARRYPLSSEIKDEEIPVYIEKIIHEFGN